MQARAILARLRHSAQFWLALALFTALGLRLLGITFGLPLHLHPDESTQVQSAQHMLTGDLNPHFFRYSSLYIYQLFTLDSAAELAISLVGFTLPSPAFWMIARILTAVYGTMTVGAVYLLGREMTSNGTAIVAAWLVALNPEHIRQSHYATVDIPMTFWIVVALLLAIRVLKHPETSWQPVAVALGLAVGTKYTALLFGAVILAFLLVSQYRHERRRGLESDQRKGAWALIIIGAVLGVVVALLPVNAVLDLGKQWSTDGTLKPEYIILFDRLLWFWRATAVATLLVGVLGLWNEQVRRFANVLLGRPTVMFCIAVAATFLVTSPYILLDLPAAARDILYEYRHMLLGAAAQLAVDDPLQPVLHSGSIMVQPLYYVEWWVGQNGWLLFGLVLLGGVLLTRRVSQPNWLLVVCVISLGLTISRAASKADRYALPLVPILAIWAGYAAQILLPIAMRWAVFGVAVSALVVAPSLFVSSSILQRDFLMPNTATLAFEWVRAHVPNGMLIIREDSTPDIENATNDYRIVVTQSVFETKTLDEWRAIGAHYMLVGQLRESFYRPFASYYPRIVQGYTDLDVQATLEASFLSGGGIAGPPVQVYYLK